MICASFIIKSPCSSILLTKATHSTLLSQIMLCLVFREVLSWDLRFKYGYEENKVNVKLLFSTDIYQFWDETFNKTLVSLNLSRWHSKCCLKILYQTEWIKEVEITFLRPKRLTYYEWIHSYFPKSEGDEELGMVIVPTLKPCSTNLIWK